MLRARIYTISYCLVLGLQSMYSPRNIVLKRRIFEQSQAKILSDV